MAYFRRKAPGQRLRGAHNRMSQKGRIYKGLSASVKDHKIRRVRVGGHGDTLYSLRPVFFL